MRNALIDNKIKKIIFHVWVPTKVLFLTLFFLNYLIIKKTKSRKLFSKNCFENNFIKVYFVIVFYVFKINHVFGNLKYFQFTLYVSKYFKKNKCNT